jgi:hypothetical protein
MQPNHATPSRLHSTPTHPHRILSSPASSQDRRNDPLAMNRLNMEGQARRDVMAAMDRKRRLTNTAVDHGRRRHVPTGTAGRALDDLLSSDEDLPSAHASSSHQSNASHEVIDLTGSSPPSPTTLRRPLASPHARRGSSNNARQYVAPRWQPDSEASECPICGRQFTWLFRRHHCRKCGRVVCNECSPHRITIPRQYIVNPPLYDDSAGPHADDDRQRIDTIDLTGDPDEDDHQQPRHTLEGGEKVRLCNPCVPDPQPESLPLFNSSEPTAFNQHRFASAARRAYGFGNSAPANQYPVGASLPYNSSTSVPGRGLFIPAYGGRPRPTSISGVHSGHTTSLGSPYPGLSYRPGHMVSMTFSLYTHD